MMLLCKHQSMQRNAFVAAEARAAEPPVIKAQIVEKPHSVQITPGEMMRMEAKVRDL